MGMCEKHRTWFHEDSKGCTSCYIESLLPSPAPCTTCASLRSRLALAENVVRRARTYRGRDKDLDKYIRAYDAALNAGKKGS